MRKNSPSNANGHAEGLAPLAHEAGPEQPELERQHRAGDGADGEGDRHVLRPALGEQQGIPIVVLHAPVVGDQRHERPGHAQRHEDDVERQGERHLRPRPRDGVHGDDHASEGKHAACITTGPGRGCPAKPRRRTANSPGMGDGRGRGPGLRCSGELSRPYIERRWAMAKDIRTDARRRPWGRAAGQPVAQQGHRVHHGGAGRPRAARAPPHPRGDDRGASRPGAGTARPARDRSRAARAPPGGAGLRRDAVLAGDPRRHRGVDADRVHPGGGRGVPEVQPDLHAPPGPVPVLPGRRPDGGDAPQHPARGGGRHRRHRR